MDLQAPSVRSHYAAAGTGVVSSATPSPISRSQLGPLSIVASFADRKTLSTIALTSRSWRLVARATVNLELVKELHLFLDVLVKVIRERLKIEGFSIESSSTETRSMIQGLKLVESLIFSTSKKEFPLLPDPPAFTHSATAKSLHQFACSRPYITLSQKFLGECLDFLTHLNGSTLDALKQKLREASQIERRADLLGCRLVSGFNRRKDHLEIRYTPFTRKLIELALRIKEIPSENLHPNLSDAEWIQVELYRLARSIEGKSTITLETWQVFYRTLFNNPFIPIHLACSFDPEVCGIPSGYRFNEEFIASLDPALTPFLAVIPPILRHNTPPLPCYTYPSLNFSKGDPALLQEIFLSEEMQLNLYVRFSLCVNLLQNLIIAPAEHLRATVVLILDLLKFSRDLRCPRKGRRHHFPYQFSEPLNYLEELMVKALNNLPDKRDRLRILKKLPHHFGSCTKDSVSFLCALASRTREVSEEDIAMLRAHVTLTSSSEPQPPADASDLDQNSP